MVLILVFSTTALAATPVTPVENVNVLYASFRNASGYGQATGLSNTNGLFTVPVTGSGSNGYGITLKLVVLAQQPFLLLTLMETLYIWVVTLVKLLLCLIHPNVLGISKV